jgi:hypothetical protein
MPRKVKEARCRKVSHILRLHYRAATQAETLCVLRIDALVEAALAFNVKQKIHTVNKSREKGEGSVFYSYCVQKLRS